jgi:hypothetical protein
MEPLLNVEDYNVATHVAFVHQIEAIQQAAQLS